MEKTKTGRTNRSGRKEGIDKNTQLQEEMNPGRRGRESAGESHALEETGETKIVSRDREGSAGQGGTESQAGRGRGRARLAMTGRGRGWLGRGAGNVWSHLLVF